MFYISEVFKIAKEHFVLSLTSAFSFCALVLSLHFSGDIKAILNSPVEELKNPYFNAVMTNNENPDYIKRKISDLPGVYAVNVNKADVKSKLAAFVGEDIKSFGESFLAKSYFSIKVLFETNISENTRKLVREYLKRLVGIEGVSLSAVKYPVLEKKKMSQSSFMVRWIDKVVVFFFALIWFVTLVLLRKYANNQAFIIEQFQRKKYVLPKLYLNSTLGLFCLCLVGAFLLHKNIEMIDALILLVVWGIGFSLFFNSKTKIKRYI